MNDKWSKEDKIKREMTPSVKLQQTIHLCERRTELEITKSQSLSNEKQGEKKWTHKPLNYA